MYGTLHVCRAKALFGPQNVFSYYTMCSLTVEYVLHVCTVRIRLRGGCAAVALLLLYNWSLTVRDSAFLQDSVC